LRTTECGGFWTTTFPEHIELRLRHPWLSGVAVLPLERLRRAANAAAAEIASSRLLLTATRKCDSRVTLVFGLRSMGCVCVSGYSRDSRAERAQT